ncbi:hypothetical protein, partial [Thermogemmatispora sp.]|uniref:hypothetical protein n=1 Tax=Thermogemmatispora sp. TaxID=1968838 RepID=UPI0026159635
QQRLKKARAGRDQQGCLLPHAEEEPTRADGAGPSPGLGLVTRLLLGLAMPFPCVAFFSASV